MLMRPKYSSSSNRYGFASATLTKEPPSRPCAIHAASSFSLTVAKLGKPTSINSKPGCSTTSSIVSTMDASSIAYRSEKFRSILLLPRY